jgi:hypothetical protein
VIVLPFLGIIIFNILGYFVYKENKNEIDLMKNNLQSENIYTKIKKFLKKYIYFL